jgi:hypothetical protein
VCGLPSPHREAAPGDVSDTTVWDLVFESMVVHDRINNSSSTRPDAAGADGRPQADFSVFLSLAEAK